MHEIRKDPLLSRWVTVCRHSLGPEEYDFGKETEDVADCPICSGGLHSARVVPYPKTALQTEGELGRKGVGMYDMMNSIGVNELIIESPEHGTRPEDIGDGHMLEVLNIYQDRLVELEKDPRFRYILIYKNSGRNAGAGYSHPHSALMATPVIPRLIKGELDGAKQYYAYKERCIFCDIMAEELKAGTRVIEETDGFAAFCPYAPKMPFEFWILPKRHSCAFQEVSRDEMAELGRLMASLLRRMRRALKEPPFNYFIHSAPNRIPRRNHWHTLGDDFHWHIEVVPRLIRTSGFEWGSDFFVLTTSPEDAAKYLKEV